MAGTSIVAPHPTIANMYVREVDSITGLILSANCTGTPDTTANVFQHGATMTRTDSGTGVNAIYQNTGSSAAPVWTLFDTGTSFALPTDATDSSTTTDQSFDLVQNTVTTGQGLRQSLTALTTGIGHQIIAAAATLTSGRYFSANDGALEVFGVGANGHIHGAQTTAPTISGNLTNGGISAAAITAGSSDVCGTITTTGTQANTTESAFIVLFNKTYTTAPKTVMLTPANAAGAQGTGCAYISATTATGFTVGIAKTVQGAATPSWKYLVIA